MVKVSARKAALALMDAAKVLNGELRQIDYSPVTDWIYAPLEYAWDVYELYLRTYVHESASVVFIGMNPGPWGMTQTGIPFGEIAAVKGWLQLSATVNQPERVLPKRPIEGFDCSKSEVSGRRLWGLFKDRFGIAKDFFQEHFVANYCPLTFMDAGGKNLTPDKFPASVRAPLELACDKHLIRTLEILKPKYLVGVGGFAEQCGLRCIESLPVNSRPHVFRILHPSPASPAANRDWSGNVTSKMIQEGVWS